MAANTLNDDFQKYIDILKEELSYVEDNSFSWDDVISVLIIQLKNTDSLNKKEQNASHATQIQLTGEKEPENGTSKTEDFFPTFTLNSSFKGWRLSLPVRINRQNIARIGGKSSDSKEWIGDSIQIRRRILNQDETGKGNPNLQICYGNDLLPLRELLEVDDYLVITKRKKIAAYEAFGVKSNIDLGSGKNMYSSGTAANDGTVFEVTIKASNESENENDEYQRAASIISQHISESGLEFTATRAEIENARQEFLSRFSPSILEALSENELLNNVFYSAGDNTYSLCCYLEMNKECRNYFGSISGGSAYKFGLFQKKDTGLWTTGSPQKPKELSEQEALDLGKEIVEALIKGARIIEKTELNSLEDYEALDDHLKDEVGERFYNWAWFHKYYSIIFNEKLSSFHNNEWQKHVLRCFCIRPSEKYYTRSGQIAMIQNYAGLRYREFIDAIRDKFGESKQFVRIGTTNSSGEESFASDWKEKSMVAIGWGQTGSLTEYETSQGIDKQGLAEALKEKYYPGDDSTSTRKAGELARFYNTGDNTVFVAVKGQELKGLVDNIGPYKYDSSDEFAHIKPGRWCVGFANGEHLPNPSEGKLTSCFEISDEDNLLYLYKKYYYPEDFDQDLVDDNDPEEYNKKMFRSWMERQVKPEGDSDAGEAYSSNSIDQYVSNIANTPLYSMSEKSVFFTTDIKLIQKTISELDSAEKKNNTQRSAVKKYLQYVIDTGESDMSVVFKTNIKAKYERNRIVFGAPGTGKSFLLKQDCDRLLDDTVGTYERVTFHPDYTYSQFVGTYKPVMDSDGRSIRYDFVPGPFMRVYVDALKSARTEAPQPHLLLIEEINRAKVAAVFGDVFQLLDRDADGVSEYEIQASEDIRRYLAKELGGTEEKYKKIRIPNNMFIWATMNSADQGVYPMDTAFKRRWNFEYLGIDEKEKDIENIGKVNIAKYDEPVVWNRLRKAINTKMSKDFNINEDKLMGPFFLSKKVLDSDENGMIKDPEKFMDAFKSKVIMYLYEDAVKQSKRKFFDGCDSSKYSSVCDAFDEIGMNIFGANFISSYYEQKRDDAE
ncbi:AAA family ATPase [Butyrivibrio sp. INlla16]|uniref:AAA family ATPase n=1 Tax=Butyrivibrio sp. INlla16 TaxID=1520807 RepID=UPI00088A4497|nr:AAA family ATPase [Butyrivibrio sp. INlla16]SDB13156.1 AAA domain (dynein-related subfamily) [Butyrivibrio sp. INlla16]